MPLIDLSQPLYRHCPNCPAHPLIESKHLADHPREGWRVEELTLTPHAGSHLDAPLHKFLTGKSIDQLPLERFTGEAYIADLRAQNTPAGITEEMLAHALPFDISGKIILLATGWGAKRARTESWLQQGPGLTREGAIWLAQRQINGVGIDYYSVGGPGEPSNTLVHEVLLGQEIWILEELNFPDAAFTLKQPATLWALPIHMQGFSGAFCRPALVSC